MLTLETRPEPLQIDLSRAAVVVVDMQNAFASPGGLLDLAGVDISGAAAVTRTIGQLLPAARACGVPVVCTDQTGGRDLLALVGNEELVQVVPCDDLRAFVKAVQNSLELTAQVVDRPQLPPPVYQQLSWQAYAKRYAAKMSEA